ncbi:Flp family type IVb pilin [Sphingopyxis indica]|uniref:Pilus assembly protein Flp/PilA n=1 Tax=Sphingopyxis indica TaxID=436663 RepID=A0A239J8E5_9SPHN|nr:Flp family type IVb pilin [Sphingopyxis indica]SNT00934.1 pilus assembly protein Flp/PilA [Sphingopyxis indica]
MSIFFRLLRSTRAATAIEYGLIIALIFLAAVSAMTSVGKSTAGMWNRVSTTTTNAVNKS